MHADVVDEGADTTHAQSDVRGGDPGRTAADLTGQGDHAGFDGHSDPGGIHLGGPLEFALDRSLDVLIATDGGCDRQVLCPFLACTLGPALPWVVVQGRSDG